MLNVLDICTGIGGFSLAGKWLIGDWRTVCYVEWDKYCQQVIQQRIQEGNLDDAPIWGDLREFDGKPWRGVVDIITAGFPCQPFSVAGKQAGADDPRNLWPDVGRVIHEVRPRHVFLENVPALLSNGYFGTVLGDLAACGYNIRWDCIPASSVGANHQRNRLWVVANAISTGTWIQPENTESSGQERKNTNPSGAAVVRPQNRTIDAERISASCADVADAGCGNGRQRMDNQHQENPSKRTQETENHKRRSSDPPEWWFVEPPVGRVANGIPSRVDRLKGLGNAVVPAVVAKAWDLLNG